MDRFKFRVWTGPSYAEDFRFIMSMNGELKQGTYLSGFDKPYQDCTIEQCTGLKDKNGNLIYEGDVIVGCGTNADWLENGEPVRHVVVWDEDNAGWGYIMESDPHKYIYLLDNSGWEIIGNVHTEEQK